MKIRFYRSSDREALQSYRLTDLRFTSHPKEAVADLENRYAILGLEEHQIVTFLILDSIIPPISRRQGACERKKQEVLRKIQLLVETYSGI